jgi:L-2-hydroxyglutarate oxidase LhgO
MLALQGDMENAGGLLALVSPVQDIGLQQGTVTHPIRVTTQDGTELACKVLVNAAGLNAVAMARRMEGLDPTLLPQAHYAKGNYFTLAGKAPFSRLIYPVPEKAGLGVHLTLDLGGQAKFGPDVQWVDDPTDLQVDPHRGDAFYAEVRKYWPALADGALQAGYAGMRPKINAPHEAAADFMIQGPAGFGQPVGHRVAGPDEFAGHWRRGLRPARLIASETAQGIRAHLSWRACTLLTKPLTCAPPRLTNSQARPTRPTPT